MKRSSRFDEIALKDVLSFVVDNRGKTVPVENSGIPLIATSNISNSELYPSIKTNRYVSEEIYLNWFRSHPQADDVILTNKGSKNGEVCLVPNPVGFCIAQDMVALRANEKIIHPKYLFASLRSSLVQKRIKSLNVDAVIPHFKKSDFDKLFLPLPSLEVQEFIGQIYFDLSAKIELNLKNNETLEGITKALFKSWFIDFDPVRAKAEAVSTGLPDEIKDLFPDSFEDSELGEIPLGWRIHNLTDIFDFLEGPGIRNWQYTNDQTGVRFINIRCIQNGDLNIENANRITEKEAFGKYKHFALLENDIVVSSSGSLGRYAVVRKDHLPLNLNTSVIRFRPKKDISTFPFLLGFVQTQLQYELEIHASGSVQRNFGPMHLRQISLLVPPLHLLKMHETHIHNLLKKRILNLSQNNVLMNLRDTILPKLISGELTVPDAEKILEEAGI